ncbi:N-acetyltransferase family protein [Leptolyngbya sp. AN03gr2]|uniref:GNAT family N-acetyltransferase n=1 Tax=unclassified Leptolyngbya TaxID=2650499 RepID=UPI003D3190A9
MLSVDVNVAYRTATSKDVDVLLELVGEFHKIEKLPFDPVLDRVSLQQFLSTPALGRVWLITERDHVIGYVAVTFSYSIEFRGLGAYIDELYLRSDYRGQGIGSRTLKFVEQVCRSLNIPSLALSVHEDNERAYKVYRKAGYSDRGYQVMMKSIA